MLCASGSLVGAFAAVGCLFSLPQAAGAITFGQVDTFQDGTTNGWQQGGSSPNPTSNVNTGGPAGVNDAFGQNISIGGAGPGSKMIMFNTAQWTGNYNAAGVDRITLHMANFGPTALHMRVALRGGPSGTLFGSTAAAVLPPDGVWRLIDLDLATSSLTSFSGADTLAQVLGNVVEVRLLSAVGGPSFTGDPIVGRLGVDNVIAHDIAGAIFRLTGMTFASGVPRINFTTIAGRSHRVERKNGLTEPNWIPLSNASNVPGTGAVVQIDDLDPGAGSLPKRFYRAQLLPP